jgi:monoterpene epsilon-lactone hydrolase
MTAESLRHSIERRRRAGRPDPPRALRRRVHIDRCDEIGFPVYTVRPRDGEAGRRIVYTHGGSYLHTLSRQHWLLIGKLAKRLAATIVVPDYLLAPEHTWRESFPQMVDLVCRTADEAPAGCSLVGDSSGGGYSLAIAQRLAAGGRIPMRLVLIAPFLDVAMTSPVSRAIDPVDPWLSVEGLREAGRLWAGMDDPRRPEISPLFGQLAGIGPLLVFTGTRDVLNPQARNLLEQSGLAGAGVELVEEDGLIHDYPLMPIPEARRAIDYMVDFLARK